MQEGIVLNNGMEMPHMGFGTIGQSGESLVENVAFALRNGYDLIDTANRYGNETEVGEGLKRSGRRREDFFLETRLGPTLYEKDQAVCDTLTRLGVDYIDIMILHHPVNDYRYAYGMLEKAYREGKVRAIGLSNFPVEKIREILDQCEIPPALMQTEGHPYFPAETVRAYCREKRIALQTWFPLGHGSRELIEEPLFASLAGKYHKTPAQVILRWHVQMGFCPVPGSASPAHIRENADICDFMLTDGEMEEIAGLNRHAPIYQVTPESLRKLAVTKCNFETGE